MGLGSYPRAYAMKSVAITSSILSISSTLINFATSDLVLADRAVITPNSSNIAMIAWGTTAPSATLGHPLNIGQAPLVIEGNLNIQQICVTSATTLAAAASITLEKH
jgi:hypothetical protein